MGSVWRAPKYVKISAFLITAHGRLKPCWQLLLLLLLLLDRWAKFVNDLEIEIRSLITKLHKTLSIGAKIYTKDTYTKLFQEILCKTVEFIVFYRFSY